MGERIIVQIDAPLVQKMRAKAIADGLPNAHSIPDEELLAALIRAALAEEAEPVEDEEPVVVMPPPDIVWVSESGVKLLVEPPSGDVVRLLADQEKLNVLEQSEEWLKVVTIDDLTGWVLIESITTKDPYSHIPPQFNVRGIHGAAGAAAPPRPLWDAWIAELKKMGMAWYKQLDAGDPNDIGPRSTFAWVRKLKRNGIEPIIRYHQDQMFPERLYDLAFEKMRRYAAEGIVWCEIGNEPNLDRYEWHSNYRGKVTWQDPFYPRTIVTNWIQDAERALAAGARPGLYALAPTDWEEHRPHPQFSSVMFYRRMFEYVASEPNLLVRSQRLFEPGKAWLAVHAATYEWSPDFDPFPPGEPPYDMCLRGYEIPLCYMRELLDVTDVVVISTEGGVFTRDSSSMSGHKRLNSHQEHAQRTVEMFDWIQKKSPLQAMCPWLICNVYESIGHSDPTWAHDSWYDGRPPDLRPKPVVQGMKDSRPAW